MRGIATLGRVFVVGTSVAALYCGDASAQSLPNGEPFIVPKNAARVAIDPNPLEQVYTPISTCRLFDTRQTTSIPANSKRTFFVSGNTGFEGQGGVPGGCGIPNSATSATMQVTVLTATRTGRLSIFPDLATAPDTYVSSFGATSAADGSVIVGGTGSATVGLASNQIGMLTRFATIGVIGDATGYFSPQIRAVISASGTILSGSGRVVSVVHTLPGLYTVTIDRSATSCAAVVSPHERVFGYADVTNAVSANVLRVSTWRTLAGIQIPSDLSFQIVVSC